MPGTDGRPSVSYTYHLATAEDNFRPACGASLVKYVSPLPITKRENVNCPACLALSDSDAPLTVDHSELPSYKNAHWEHDCANCMYLGTDTFHGEYWDMYVAERRTHHGTLTLIARYGNEPGEYLSGLGFVGREPMLALAAVLAIKQGLIEGDDIR